MPSCKICEAPLELVFNGPIRDGVFGKTVASSVWRCQGCLVESLPPTNIDLEAYYRSDEYRQNVGEQPNVEDYFRRHDIDEYSRLGIVASQSLRGRVIADVGCGGGSFLDIVRGAATQTIGVEPMISYHPSLKERGHTVYANISEALSRWRKKVDFAVCFSVIEHVDNPQTFLSEIRELLAPGGRLVLSTPNRDEILMQIGPSSYKSFFYRKVHTYYFNSASLRSIAVMSGFSPCEVRHIHRFNFANFIGWMRDEKPTGNGGISLLPSHFDATWKATLEEAGLADYLYCDLIA